MEKMLGSDLLGSIELCDHCHTRFPPTPNTAIPHIADYVAQYPGNHVSLYHETPALAPLLQKAEDEITDYDEVIRRTRETLKRLEENRARLWTLKERLRWIMKPSIRRLPPELLTRIFYTCWGDGYTLRKPQLDDYEAFERPNCRTTLTLSHVSAQWRAIAFHESRLWTCIKVRLHADDDSTLAQSIHNFTKFCLEKSKGRPLHIYFYAPSIFDSGTSIYHPCLHRPILAELFKYCGRWRSAVLRLHGTDHIDFPKELPLLESLIIRRATSEALSFPARVVYTPRLRILETERMAEGLSGFQDVHTLKTFSTDDRNIEAILSVLQRSPNLKQVTIKPCAPMLHHHINPIPTVVSNCESLTIGNFQGSSFILQYLTLPSLKYLKISGDASSYHMNVPELCEFFRRSQPPLDTLEISGIALFPSELTRALDLLPSITKLHLLDMSTTNLVFGRDFIRDMTIPSIASFSAVGILPNLKMLSLTAWSSSLDGQMVVEMVRSRVVGLSRNQLRRFEIKCRRSVLDRRGREQLTRLADEGLSIDIQGWE
ncbi:hypothetical protein VNI00_006001 [Paramarasmius palmivorus]|uniref:F-box domain-containing protein n=1 Tax=Paramarasmius palmivorus TaxID=297713 RepID=A0AAW0DG42_9AGAR